MSLALVLARMGAIVQDALTGDFDERLWPGDEVPENRARRLCHRYNFKGGAPRSLEIVLDGGHGSQYKITIEQDVTPRAQDGCNCGFCATEREQQRIDILSCLSKRWAAQTMNGTFPNGVKSHVRYR